jgi:hypothetical protein
VQQRQLTAKWLLCSKKFFCVREFIKTDSATAVQLPFLFHLNILAEVFENLGHPLSNFMYIIPILCIVQEIQKYEIESIVLNHAVFSSN